MNIPICPTCHVAYETRLGIGRLELRHPGIFTPQGCKEFAESATQWTFEEQPEARAEADRLSRIERRERARRSARQCVHDYARKTSKHGKLSCLDALAWNLYHELGIDPGEYHQGNWDDQVSRLATLIPKK